MEHGIHTYDLGTWISGESAVCGVLDGGTKGAMCVRLRGPPLGPGVATARIVVWDESTLCLESFLPLCLHGRHGLLIAQAMFAVSFHGSIGLHFLLSNLTHLGIKHNAHLKAAVV